MKKDFSILRDFVRGEIAEEQIMQEQIKKLLEAYDLRTGHINVACCRAETQGAGLLARIDELEAQLASADVPAANGETYCKNTDAAWAQFCAGIGDGPSAPYPGMIRAFESYYGQSFADKAWRNEASVWAAAWGKAKPDQQLASGQEPLGQVVTNTRGEMAFCKSQPYWDTAVSVVNVYTHPAPAQSVPKVHLALPDGDNRIARCVFAEMKADGLHICITIDD